MKRILFISPYRPAFVGQDIELLSSKFNVVESIYVDGWKWLTPISWIRQFLFLLWNIWSVRAIVCSFAGYWSVLPTVFGKLTGRPVYVIVHGTECCSIPAIVYGQLRRATTRMACRFSFSFCTQILAVSESLIKSDDKYDQRVGPQGILHHFPNLKTPIQVIPNGFKPINWEFQEDGRTQHSFIAVITKGQFMRRGGPLLLEVAKVFDDCSFTIVGSVPSGVEVPTNVTVLPYLTQKDLEHQFQKHQFYIQLSVYEGFGCAMAEAMLCGCIPIGTAVNAVPQIIGDTGFVLQRSDKHELLDLIKQALSDSNLSPLQARERIVAFFEISNREKGLFNLIN